MHIGISSTPDPESTAHLLARCYSIARQRAIKERQGTADNLDVRGEEPQPGEDLAYSQALAEALV